MRVLKADEKKIYDSMMKGIKITMLDCWDYKKPKDFEPMYGFRDRLKEI